MSQNTPKKGNYYDLPTKSQTESNNKGHRGILSANSSKKERQRKISWGDVRVRYFYPKGGESQSLLVWDDSNENLIEDNSYELKEPVKTGRTSEELMHMQNVSYGLDGAEKIEKPPQQEPERDTFKYVEDSNSSDYFEVVVENKANEYYGDAYKESEVARNKYVNDFEALFREQNGSMNNLKEKLVNKFDSINLGTKDGPSQFKNNEDENKTKSKVAELPKVLEEEEGVKSSPRPKSYQNIKENLDYRSPDRRRQQTEKEILDSKNGFVGENSGHRFSFGSGSKGPMILHPTNSTDKKIGSELQPLRGKRKSEQIKKKIEELKEKMNNETNQNKPIIDSDSLAPDQNILELLAEESKRKKEKVYNTINSQPNSSAAETFEIPPILKEFEEKLKSIGPPIMLIQQSAQAAQKGTKESRVQYSPPKNKMKVNEIIYNNASGIQMNSPMLITKTVRSSYTLSPGLLSLGLETSDLFPSEKKSPVRPLTNDPNPQKKVDHIFELSGKCTPKENQTNFHLKEALISQFQSEISLETGNSIIYNNEGASEVVSEKENNLQLAGKTKVFRNGEENNKYKNDGSLQNQKASRHPNNGDFHENIAPIGMSDKANICVGDKIKNLGGENKNASETMKINRDEINKFSKCDINQTVNPIYSSKQTDSKQVPFEKPQIFEVVANSLSSQSKCRQNYPNLTKTGQPGLETGLFSPMPGKRNYKDYIQQEASDNQVYSFKRLKLERMSSTPLPSRFQNYNGLKSGIEVIRVSSPQKIIIPPERGDLTRAQTKFKDGSSEKGYNYIEGSKERGQFGSPSLKGCSRLFMSSGKKNYESNILMRINSGLMNNSLCDHILEMEVCKGRTSQEEVLNEILEEMLKEKLALNRRLKEELDEAKKENQKLGEKKALRKEAQERIKEANETLRKRILKREIFIRNETIRSAKLTSFFESVLGFISNREELIGGGALSEDVIHRFVFTVFKRFCLEIRYRDWDRKIQIADITIVSLSASSQSNFEKAKKKTPNPLSSDINIAACVEKQVRRKFLNAIQKDIQNVLNFIVYQIKILTKLSEEIEAIQTRHNIIKLYLKTQENNRDFLHIEYRMRFCFPKRIIFTIGLDDCLEDIRMELKGPGPDEHGDIFGDFLNAAEGKDQGRKGGLLSNENVDESINKRLNTIFNKELYQVWPWKLIKMLQQFDNFKLV